MEPAEYTIVKGRCGVASHWTVIYNETGDQVACLATKKSAEEYVKLPFSQKMAAPLRED